MLNSLNIAASGMHSQQMNIDVIANNLANSNTTGFKKSRVDFEDLMYRELIQNTNRVVNSDLQKPVGVGASIASTSKIFSAGDAQKTERPLDVAIQGEGFFEVMLPDNNYAYTRTGSFQIDRDGVLTTIDGHPLSARIEVPNDSEDILITEDGKVLAKVSGDSELVDIGQLDLSRFVNTAGLNPIGDNLYTPSDQSGDALYGIPGEDGVGTLNQGFLETSNVNLVEELTNLILAQRAYEINSKVVQAADEILGIVNNLRR